MEVLTFNGRKFGYKKESVTNSLFKPGGTLDGYYTLSLCGRNIWLYSGSGERIGAVTARGVLASAIKQKSGQYWYSYADIALIGKYPSYMAQCDDVSKALAQCGIKRIY